MSCLTGSPSTFDGMSNPADTADDRPAHRYDAALAQQIEASWQDRWEKEGTFEAPNPTGLLSEGFEAVADRPKLYVLDMFPYPSGAGLHVGHPLGYIGTDVYARYQRMNGRNVLHTMGYDAFGLPAEQYAIQTGTHPRITTETNIANMRRQLRRLGLGHDPRRSVVTTDPHYYRWTQWIFLQLFESWYDPDADRARPIADLEAELDAGTREPADGTNTFGRPWAALGPSERRSVVNDHRLAYLHESPVNWCPGLGTVLSNEEVTADGRSERGNFPVYRRSMKQWMLRITAYADRLIDDLDELDWPEPIKLMQRNWIGRSTGARIRFPVEDGTPEASPEAIGIEVFTTRPDTIFGATYLVVAPEHPLVDELVTDAWPDEVPASWTGGAGTPGEAVAAYQAQASRRSELDRQTEGRQKTGVFTGSTALNPATGASIPVFVADYVLMGYGTGAIMAVPGQDQRDWEFAEAFEPADRPHRRPARGLGGRGVHRRGPGHRLRLPRRPGGHRGQGPHHRVARGRGPRVRHDPVQAAGLAVQPPALLGRAVPHRLRRRRPAPRPARGRAARRAAPDGRLQPEDVGPGGLRTRAARWAGCRAGRRSPSTSATGRRSTAAS